MTGELLKRFNVFRSTDRARSQEQLSRSLCPHTLTMRGEEPIETVQSLAPLASSQLVYIEYSGPIAVSRARIDDYYLLLLPHRGPSEVTVDGRAVVSDEDYHGVLQQASLLDGSHDFADSIVER